MADVYIFEQSTILINQEMEKPDEANIVLVGISTQEHLAMYKDVTSYYISEAKTNLEIARNYKEKYKNLRQGVDKS